MRYKTIKLLSVLLLISFVAFHCASAPKINKTEVLVEMNQGKQKPKIEFYKANAWRAYKLNDHEKVEITGKDMLEIYLVSQNCLSYYIRANKMMFAEGKVNPKLLELSSDQLGKIIKQFEENLETVCSKTKIKKEFKKTYNSVFFHKNFYPFLYQKYKADLSALVFIKAVKERQEQNTGF